MNFVSNYKSRKLLLSLVVMGLVVVGGLFCVWQPAFAAVYGTYCNSLLLAGGIYSASNAAVKMQAIKAKPETPEEGDEVTPDEAAVTPKKV